MSEKIPSRILKSPFFENYILYPETVLGAGSFGSIILGKKKESKKKVAIKIQFGKSVDFGCNEIKIMKKIGGHAHIIRTIDSFPEPEEQSYYNYNIIVMEKANGSLSQFLQQNNGKLEKALLIQLFLDILTGLRYAHELGSSHSDIKPSNILFFIVSSRNKKNAQEKWVFRDDIIFKLCDWGIGEFGDENLDVEATQTFDNLGYSKAFAAPENQTNNKRKKTNLSKSDMYSLGMSILISCGVEIREINMFSTSMSEEDQNSTFNKIIKKREIKENYGNGLVQLLEGMLKFNRNARFKYDEIKKALKKIVKEMNKEKKTEKNSEEEKEEKPKKKKKKSESQESDKCDKCKIKDIEGVIIELKKCKHKICEECLQNHFLTSFEQDNLFQLDCPICNKKLKKTNIEKLLKVSSNLENKIGDFFEKCRNKKCEFFTNEWFLQQTPKCHDWFCINCLTKIYGERKCLFCFQSLKEKDLEELSDTLNKCQICKANNQIYSLKCCGLQLCQKCFEIHVYEKYEANKERNSNYEVICRCCLENLGQLKMKEILTKDSYTKFKETSSSKESSFIEKSTFGKKSKTKAETKISSTKKTDNENSSRGTEKGSSNINEFRPYEKNKDDRKNVKTECFENQSNIKNNIEISMTNPKKGIHGKQKNNNFKTEKEFDMTNSQQFKETIPKADLLKIGSPSEINVQNKDILVEANSTKKENPPEKNNKNEEETNVAKKEVLPEENNKNEEKNNVVKKEVSPDENNKNEGKVNILEKEHENHKTEEEVSVKKETFPEENHKKEEKVNALIKEIIPEENHKSEVEIIGNPPKVDLKKGACGSCKKEPTEKESIQSKCGHIFCKFCISADLNYLINHPQNPDEKIQLESIKCPICSELFSEDFIHELKNHNISDYYNDCLSKKYVEKWRKDWEKDKVDTPGEDLKQIYKIDIDF